MKTQYEDRLQELYAEVGRLTTELTWLKKNLADSLDREQRLALVGPSPEEVAIKHRIDEIYTDHPYYGSR